MREAITALCLIGVVTCFFASMQALGRGQITVATAFGVGLVGFIGVAAALSSTDNDSNERNPE